MSASFSKETLFEPMANPASAGKGLLQRKCACGSHTIAGDTCESCRKEEGPGQLQRAAKSDVSVNEAPPVVNEVLRSPGQPLDQQTRAFFEPRFGHDFSHVRLHTDQLATESARAVNAQAYTVGRNIVFEAGRYEPGSVAGMRLLAHELAHTIQQRDVADVSPYEDLPLGPSDSLQEREADAAYREFGLDSSRTKSGPSVQCKKWDDLPIYEERPDVMNAKKCPVSDTGTLSQVSWGETSGLYPTKDNKYTPEKWDPAKTCELLSARSAVHAVGQRGEKVHKASPGKDPIEQKLKPYHYIENFPALDAEISDVKVRWFYLSKKSSLDTHPTMSSLTSVKKYGPFYNNGGGDVGAGDVYIHFYRKK